jgi:pSer/pThr/pTyr-binding forkhead associated (FHA) protein
VSASLVLDKELFQLQDLTFIGRDAQCDIVLEEESVNRYHALILRRADDYLLLDFKSINGTFVNGLQVTERSLRDRDAMQIGTRVLVFRQERRESADPHQEGVAALQSLAELTGWVLEDLREAIGPVITSAMFRPVGGSSWWLLAGDSPSLGPAKRGLLEEWASRDGVFHTEAIPMTVADTLDPSETPGTRWWLGLSMRLRPGASLLVMFERDADPGAQLASWLALLEDKLGRLASELAEVEAPSKRDLPPPPARNVRRGILAGRIAMSNDRTLELHTSTIYRIGRDPARCDLVVDDDQVSRQHALLVVDPRGQVTALDFKSVNGILVGGKPTLRAKLKDGDRIDVGSQQLRFESALLAPTGPGPVSGEDYEPCIGIRARAADLDANRPHFAPLETQADVLAKLMALVREQFELEHIATLWLPREIRQVPDLCARVRQFQLPPDGEMPAIPLRAGIAGQAVDHVLANGTGYFVRDYNLGGAMAQPGPDEFQLLAGVGSFFLTPITVEETNLIVLLGITKAEGRQLGRPEWGTIQALVQAAGDRYQELQPRP